MINALFRYPGSCLLLFLTACNPFPKKDTHPELPFLSELVAKTELFTKIIDYKGVSAVSFLKDDRILVMPDNSNLPLKITDAEGKVLFQLVYDFKKPLYLDPEGNLYGNGRKYFHPDYARAVDFENVMVSDSLRKKYEEFELKNPGNDSLNRKLTDAYEIGFLKRYQMTPCEFVLVNTEKCDVFEVRNNKLLVRQTTLTKNDFAKKEEQLKEFDEAVLLRWRNGRMATPEYMHYYQINDEVKFKIDDVDLLKFGILKGETYLDTPYGLFKFHSRK